MPSRRQLLLGTAALAAAGVTAMTVGRRKPPPARPPGVPLGPFDGTSTTEAVTDGIDLAGRTVLITGVTSGLGLESMRVLAMRGAHVVGTGRTLDKATRACAAVSGRTTPVALELTDFESVVRCAATVSGLPLAPFPDAVIAVAQILIGTWLGSTFRRELFLDAGRLVVATAVTSLLLVALCTAFAASLALVTEVPWNILVLGAAPGSITEMALTARFLHEDVALITAFHLVRIFLIIPNTPWMLKLVHKRAGPPAAGEAGEPKDR